MLPCRASEAHRSLGSMSAAWPGRRAGTGAAGRLLWLVFRGPLEHPLVLRYFAGHPINMVETTLVLHWPRGAAAKSCWTCSASNRVLPSISLRRITAEASRVSKASEWLEALGRAAGARAAQLSRPPPDRRPGIGRSSSGSADRWTKS